MYIVQNSYFKGQCHKKVWLSIMHMRCCFRPKQCSANWFYIVAILRQGNKDVSKWRRQYIKSIAFRLHFALRVIGYITYMDLRTLTP